MLRSVPLSQLPTGVQFPTHLLDKVSYDPLAKQLRFKGFMSKGDFDLLSKLSNDLEYLRTLEHLFQICEYAPETPTSSVPWRIVGLAGAVLLVLGIAWWTIRPRGENQKSHANPSVKFDNSTVRR